MSEKPLSGQVALVTGGSRGIGAAIVRELGKQGASVAINYARSADAAQALAAELSQLDCQADTFGFDVSDEDAVSEGVKAVVEKFGRLDVLVNNAGIADDGLLVRTKGDQWRRTLEVNLSSCFYCSRAVAKPMMKARGGRIINISSVIGEMGNAGQVAYSASKSGIFGLTKSLARELGSRGITVNAITPGWISTDMTSEMSEEQTAGILAQVPLGRLGSPDDVAATVAFLAGPGSSYVTGQILGVNGGMYM